MPQKFGAEWNPAVKAIPRGPWPVCGEIDHGLVAGIEAAITVVFDDPLFGLFAYGGTLQEREGAIHVLCRDGVRQRFCCLAQGRRFLMELDRDGFSREHPVVVSADLSRVAFTIEPRSDAPHATRLSLRGLPAGEYHITAGDTALSVLSVTAEAHKELLLPMKAEAAPVAITRKR